MARKSTAMDAKNLTINQYYSRKFSGVFRPFRQSVAMKTLLDEEMEQNQPNRFRNLG